MSEKTVGIDELYEHYPSEFQEAFEQWLRGQEGIIGENWEDLAYDTAVRELHGTGWEIDGSEYVHYRVSCSQGDGVAIQANFDLDLASEQQLDAMRQNFSMNTELTRIGLMQVCSVTGRGFFSRADWSVDTFWDHDDEDDVVEDGVYKGLPLITLDQLAGEEGHDEFAEFLYQDVENAEREAYTALTDDLEYQTSEEAFIEFARDTGEEFIVECDEETELET